MVGIRKNDASSPSVGAQADKGIRVLRQVYLRFSNKSSSNQPVFHFYLVHGTTLFITVHMTTESKIHFELLPKLSQVFTS